MDITAIVASALCKSQHALIYPVERTKGFCFEENGPLDLGRASSWRVGRRCRLFRARRYLFNDTNNHRHSTSPRWGTGEDTLHRVPLRIVFTFALKTPCQVLTPTPPSPPLVLFWLWGYFHLPHPANILLSLNIQVRNTQTQFFNFSVV